LSTPEPSSDVHPEGAPGVPKALVSGCAGGVAVVVCAFAGALGASEPDPVVADAGEDHVIGSNGGGDWAKASALPVNKTATELSNPYFTAGLLFHGQVWLRERVAQDHRVRARMIDSPSIAPVTN
jgi:hypothetical protein